MGPYYTNEDDVTAKFISVCVFETIKIFQVCWNRLYLCKYYLIKASGLKTSLPIFDGAAHLI